MWHLVCMEGPQLDGKKTGRSEAWFKQTRSPAGLRTTYSATKRYRKGGIDFFGSRPRMEMGIFGRWGGGVPCGPLWSIAVCDNRIAYRKGPEGTGSAPGVLGPLARAAAPALLGPESLWRLGCPFPTDRNLTLLPTIISGSCGAACSPVPPAVLRRKQTPPLPVDSSKLASLLWGALGFRPRNPGFRRRLYINIYANGEIRNPLEPIRFTAVRGGFRVPLEAWGVRFVAFGVYGGPAT